jgi:carbon-monoxide dehydrogenase iron sulfur subunit
MCFGGNFVKKLIVKNAEDCIACHSCEAACAQAYYKTVAVEYASISISNADPSEAKIQVCTQCGMCADVCPVEAIHENSQGVYTIDRKSCIGCLACMDICPADVIVKSHDNPFATKCTACGICVKACPQKVLEIVVA